jgi:tetratricopeptide (TPR) repeat protein
VSPVAAGGEREALLQEAQSLRQARRVPEALARLEHLRRHHPRFSQLYQESGHCQVLLGNAPAAIAALQAAVQLNPTLPASWDMLEQLYRRQGDGERATRAAQHLALLQQLPSAVVVASSLLADDDLDNAEAVIREHLDQDPGNPGSLGLLARILMKKGEFAGAEALLAPLVQRAPDDHAARYDYGLALLQLQNYAAARREAEVLLAHDPAHRGYRKQYAAACIGLGDHEPVIDLYAELLAEPSLPGPEIAELRLWRGNALKVTGRQAEAIADYRAALDARPDYGVAWFSLANLKTYGFTDADLDRLRAAEARNDLHDLDRVYLGFALGKALEDRGAFAESWASYGRANALRRSASLYRPEVAEACVERLRTVFTAEVFATRAGGGVQDAAPIFIVGLPRSGSTLVEQILASHSAVEGTQELTEIDRMVAELCGRDAACGLPVAPEAILDLSAGEIRALGERFLAETRTYRRLGRPFFIDKMPNNVWHIGLIHLILPKASIIDVRREPMACGFSNFKQLFGAGNQEFSYSLEDLARHYRAYRHLMQHWDAVLPGRVLTLAYEDVVDDLKASVRRLLAHCGLDFEPACLTFHETRRSIRTPSSEQVRRPIGREALDQWRHYEPWLSPLMNGLGDAVLRGRT